MARYHVGFTILWAVMALAACGSERAEESRATEDVATSAGSRVSSAREVRACDLLDLPAASRVIGSGTEHPGGDTEELTCVYVNPGVAMLTFQLGGAELYDQVTIMQPHTSMQIGSRGRYNVQASGVAAVQFVKGAYSGTLSVQPVGTPQAEYLERLMSAARDAADRLP